MNQRAAMITLSACLISHHAIAAPSVAADICKITGIVTATEKRSEERLRPMDGEMVTRDSIDVTINVTTATVIKKQMQEHCDVAGTSKTFQLRADSATWFNFDRPKVGMCIRAENEMFFDDFGGGDWIYDIKTLDTNDCTAQ